MNTQPIPSVISPMLLSAAPEPFDSPAHLFEIKWDGIRCIGHVGEAVCLQTRRLHTVTAQFPEVAEALRQFPEGTVLDGELVVFEGGRPSFEAVRRRIAMRNPQKILHTATDRPTTFMVFDLLYLAGSPMMALPLEERRRHLLELEPEDGPVCIPEHFDSGTALYVAAIGQGLEGIVAKRRDSRYTPGRRSPAWVKCKPPDYDSGRFDDLRRRL
ncbi:ATP-dependent DNA ligase [Thiohalomonas denitrificans]|uniref:ATP-dependent DNA ligase n=1 Tax=Thiohalomonas denitrificans TaxID=415747 RepID=UPI0026E97556|nr:hypothetical protein [Thiohalomonas denitrificans]